MWQFRLWFFNNRPQRVFEISATTSSGRLLINVVMTYFKLLDYLCSMLPLNYVLVLVYSSDYMVYGQIFAVSEDRTQDS